MREAADEGGDPQGVSFDTLVEAVATAVEVGKRELIPVNELEHEFFAGRSPVAVGEVKVMENLIIVRVEFGRFFDVKELKVGGGGGGEEEELEKEEEGEG